MTKYWIDLAGCQSVINRINEKLDGIRTDFDRTPDDVTGIREAVCAPDEPSIQDRPAMFLDRTLAGLLAEELPEHFEGIVEAIRRKVDALQAVVDYYAYGDAEMAHEAAGTLDRMPEFIQPNSGYVAGHPALGNTAPPEYVQGHPALGLAGDQQAQGSSGTALHEDVATTTPFTMAGLTVR